VPRFAAEAPWAWRVVRRFARQLPARRKVEIAGRPPVVADASGDAPWVLVIADPEAYLAPPAARRLLASAAGSTADLVVPVTNEPWSEATRGTPPFVYHNPTLLVRASEAAAQAPSALVEDAAPRSPVYAVRRDSLEKLPRELPLADLPSELGRRGGRCAVDPGAYLHRYGAMDGQARSDLAALLPRSARTVLDVGCSGGATAALLRERGVTRVVGIEPDPGDAAEAAKACDQVLRGRLEDVADDLAGQFDGILFGDVLEHLAEPAAALLRVRPWLSASGAVVASVPNVGHWSVIADLLGGRFDYVPYSILSGTHLRFFTRATIQDLFESCGYGVESISTVEFPAPAALAGEFAMLRAYPGSTEDLTAAEFLVVAKPV
jgi:2-polyprenyl-3-methyl-5-hydroxy-6-metoxy-1,4-benzoquinol methylase